jgi:hypothetical protein
VEVAEPRRGGRHERLAARRRLPGAQPVEAGAQLARAQLARLGEQRPAALGVAHKPQLAPLVGQPEPDAADLVAAAAALVERRERAAFIDVRAVAVAEQLAQVRARARRAVVARLAEQRHRAERIARHTAAGGVELAEHHARAGRRAARLLQHGDGARLVHRAAFAGEQHHREHAARRAVAEPAAALDQIGGHREVLARARRVRLGHARRGHPRRAAPARRARRLRARRAGERSDHAHDEVAHGGERRRPRPVTARTATAARTSPP